MSLGLPVRLVDSFTVPKDILQEFTHLAEEEEVDLFIQIHSCFKRSSSL
jgi:splicing factor 3B subunit 1